MAKGVASQDDGDGDEAATAIVVDSLELTEHQVAEADVHGQIVGEDFACLDEAVLT